MITGPMTIMTMEIISEIWYASRKNIFATCIKWYTDAAMAPILNLQWSQGSNWHFEESQINTLCSHDFYAGIYKFHIPISNAGSKIEIKLHQFFVFLVSEMKYRLQFCSRLTQSVLRNMLIVPFALMIRGNFDVILLSAMCYKDKQHLLCR